MLRDFMRRRLRATFKVEALNSAGLNNPFKEFVKMKWLSWVHFEGANV